MTTKTQRQPRRGSILPLAVLTMVSMCGFVALAIDLGLIAVAKTQCQNSADAAAMAGARSLDGTTGQNLGDVNTPGSAMYNALHCAEDNKVLTDTLPAANVTMTFGAWHYNSSTQLFVPQFPPVSPDNYNLVQVNVTYTVNTTFAPVFKYIDPSFNSLIAVQAQAQAAHRPRDVAIVLDYSGSMNNESDLWNNEAYLDNGATNSTLGLTWPQTNNPDYTSNSVETVYPVFGHYQGSTATAQSNKGNDYTHYDTCPNLLSPAANAGSPLYNSTLIGKSNVSNDLTGTLGIGSMAASDFYQNARGAGAVKAFTSVPDSNNYDVTPGGDNYLRIGNNSSNNYAKTVNDILGSTSWNSSFETQGYKFLTADAFDGYTQGPRYWGKTFFMWPPDPTNDWRKNFFLTSDGSAPLKDNTQLFQNSYPGYKDPPGNYVINYKAILNWIKNTGPNPFPSQLRSGNVLFYSSIPTDVGGTAVGPTGPYDHTQKNSAITNLDQRFWKEYIDWTLGVWRDPTGSNVQHTQQPTCSIGPDFMFGTVQISTPPGPDGNGHTRYMDYKDNPWRPRHRMWFGPMTMIQFMSDCGYLPGTTHDISMFPMKQGVGGALTDIQNNHPNDLVSMLLFSRPVFGNDPPGVGVFNAPQYSLTNDYAAMLTTLWVPTGSGSSDMRIWDSSGNQNSFPSAHGDYDANTSSSFGFMLAYNQFSGSTALQNVPNINNTGNVTVGGLGRKGATRLVIFETDGMANQDSIPVSGFTNNGSYNSYYPIRPADKVNGGGYNQTNLLQVVEAICNRDDSTPVSVPNGYPTPPNYPGYATVNKPVIVHTIAFGAIFEPSNVNSIQTSSVTLLQNISTIGGTTFPSSATDPTNGYKWCIGTLQQRQTKLQQAFLNILDSSVPVSLIQ